MKRQFLFIAAFITTLCVSAQTYTVGIRTITYTDAARANRSVGVEFRYPGTNTAVAAGQFPFVIFGHGFQMDAAPYYPYADSLAKQGYIVGLVTTETSLSPVHANFAQDLIYVHDKLISESNTNTASVFYQKATSKGAIGGHSMGAGCTVLSAQYGNPAACYFTFAAATTNPSSITAAHFLTKPYLAFAGSRDCIAPYATNQLPMYDSSNAVCKFLINIKDGLHCQFGSGNFQCNFGEGFSGCASSPLTREQQINKSLSFLVPFLDYYLKGDCSAWTVFESRYAADVTDSLRRNCTNIVPSNAGIAGNDTFCVGTSTVLTANPVGFQYLWSDNSTADTLEVNTTGNYSVAVGNGVCVLPAVSLAVTQVDTPVVNILPQGFDLTFQSSTNAVQSIWYDVQGNIVGSGSTFTPANNGDYYVVVTDDAGCTGRSAAYNYLITAIMEQEKRGFKIYPNPVSGTDKIMIEMGGAETVSVALYDVTGKVLLSKMLSGTKGYIETESVCTGMYYLSIKSDTILVLKKVFKL